ncbi:hypothetical protein M0R45_036915 [Rubus argutus]|uniref:Nuclear transcription factor Y subunit n=1 Tax=Rubus argutus TaxID=59490 RepID=A0AAW1W2Y2_RUBAR
MMPAKSKDEDPHLEPGAQTVMRSTIQPWWRGAGNRSSFGESASALSLPEHGNGVVMNRAMQSQANAGLDGGANFNKDVQTTVGSQSDGNSGRENQQMKSTSSAVVAKMGEHLDPNSQMELVGHSIVLTSYPYSDPQYGGILTHYGPQAMVPHHFYGLHHGRMPLPLEMEEEPVYVNAKQYHGILRRRQSRAKAELERKLIKVRKPYLHESRHQHALRRARGCGGRFLNTKKQVDSDANSTSEKTINWMQTFQPNLVLSAFQMIAMAILIPPMSSKKDQRETMQLNGSSRGAIHSK